MRDLDTLRRELNGLDRELVALFERRMNISVEVGAYKAAHDMPILQPEREREVLASRVALLEEPKWAPATRRFFQLLMDVGKDAQLDVVADVRAHPVVAYQGVAAGYGEQAASGHFPEAQLTPCATFDQVVEAVEQGKADYGVLPLENSLTGPVIQPLDLRGATGLYLVGERSLPIDHCLMMLPGGRIEDVCQVFSHEQALAQCAPYLQAHPRWRAVPQLNTALAAQLVARSGDTTLAAIASRRAAEVYGLEIVAESIQSGPVNRTRFGILGRNMNDAGSKTTVFFILRNVSGSLQQALSALCAHGINLIALHPRPMAGQPFSYTFLADFTGGVDQLHVQQALAEMQRNCEFFRVVGSYHPDAMEGAS